MKSICNMMAIAAIVGIILLFGLSFSTETIPYKIIIKDGQGRVMSAECKSIESNDSFHERGYVQQDLSGQNNHGISIHLKIMIVHISIYGFRMPFETTGDIKLRLFMPDGEAVETIRIKNLDKWRQAHSSYQGAEPVIVRVK